MKAYFKTLNLKYKILVAIAAIIFVAGITLLAMAGGGILSPENSAKADSANITITIRRQGSPSDYSYNTLGGGTVTLNYQGESGDTSGDHKFTNSTTVSVHYMTNYPFYVTTTPNPGFRLNTSRSSNTSYSGGGSPGYYSNQITISQISAYFDMASFTFNLDNQGGSGPTSCSGYAAAFSSSMSMPTLSSLPTRNGYVFQGYYTSANGQGYKIFYESGSYDGYRTISSWATSEVYTYNLYAYWLPTYSGGDGSKSTPYLISSKSDLQALAEYVNSGENTSSVYFRQTKDIDLSGSTWTPIGNSSNSFSGVYDGQNYKIEGLTINTSSSYQGLFGYVIGSSSSTKAEIKNVILENGYISGGQYTGGIVGYATNYLKISNCKNNADIKGTSYIGGIAGSIYFASSADIENCLNTGGITATSDYVGGICGRYGNTTGNMSLCVNLGSVAGSGSYAGGICGYASSSISVTSCVNDGNISGGNYVGGLCGEGYGTFSLCISKGNITSTNSTGNYVGGLIGYADGRPLTNCSAEGYIFHSGSSSYVGALIGYAYSSSNKIEACSFKGSSNKTLKIYGGTTAPTMTACWSKCGESKVFSSTPDSTWTTYWAVVPNMNDGLPIQKSLYSVASVASSTLDELKTAFRNHGFSV